MSQKRLMLAVGLSVGVLVLFQILFPPAKPPIKPPVQATQQDEKMWLTDTPQKKSSSSSSPSTPSSLSPQSSLAPVVVITTPLMRVSLNTLGGRLKSWKVTTYHDASGNDIELLPLHTTASPLEVDVAGDRDTRVVYTASQPALVLDPTTSGEIVLRGVLPSGMKIVKTLKFSGSSYEVAVGVSLYNAGPQPVAGPLGLRWERGITTQEFNDGYVNAMVGDSVERVRLKKLEGKHLFDESLRWLAFAQPFAAAAMYPPVGVQGRGVVTTTDNAVSSSIVYPNFSLEAKSGSAHEWRVFGGPQTFKDLQAPGVLLEHLLDYGRVLGLNLSWLGLWLLMALNKLYALTRNYGIAIILLTFLMKIVLWWPSQASFKSMRKMQAIAPKIEAMKERYKNNPQQLQVETMRLYKENKVNPFSGCLMMLPQIPIFIALYSILVNAAELQGQPFMAWIKDLSKADPYYVLPVLNGVGMFVQQKMTPTTDPQQAKIMLFMPIIFTFMFLNLPAGVVLYWTMQSFFSIAQQGWMLKTHPLEESTEAK